MEIRYGSKMTAPPQVRPRPIHLNIRLNEEETTENIEIYEFVSGWPEIQLEHNIKEDETKLEHEGQKKESAFISETKSMNIAELGVK